MRQKLLFVSSFAILVLLSGCAGSHPSAAPPIAVSVSPSGAQTIDQGQTKNFTATVTNDSASKGVTWTVSCNQTQCGSVSPTSTASGTPTTYTAPAAVTANLTVTVTAASASDTTKTGSGTATVSPPPQLPSTSSIQSALNAANPTPMTGTPFSFQFTLMAGNPGAGTITWAVASGSLPAGLTLSPSGLLSGIPQVAKQRGFGAGRVTSSTTSTFTVSATDSGNPPIVVASGSLMITVSPSNITVSITSPTSPPTIQQGQTVSITATVSNDPGNQGVTWTVSCAVSACGSVSPTSTASGTATTYTAPASVSANLAVTVTATSVGDTSKTAFITVTVTPPPLSVAITSPSSPPTIQQGQTVSITATVTNDPAAKGVTWAVSCAVSACGSVNPLSTPSGSPTTYTAPTPVTANLTVTVTATSVSDPTKSAPLTVTVTPPQPISVTLSPSTPQTVVQGATLQITATVANDPANAGVNWTATCSVTACGALSPMSTPSGTPTTYTAPTPVTANLTVTVTATSVTDNTKSAFLTITVTANNNAALTGDFALQFTGFADSGGEVAIAGRFHADGNGNLTGGALDINAPSTLGHRTFTGTYTVTGDGRCTLVAGTITFKCVLLASASGTRVGRIIEFDDSTGTGTRGSGEIHVQTLADASFSVINGDFALGFVGDVTITGSPNARLGVVGRFTLTATSGPTSAFSLGTVDVSAPGASFSSSLTGSLNAPDPSTGFGTGMITITVPPPIAPTPTPLTVNFAYYVVGKHQVFIASTDLRGTNVPLLSGFVQKQRQATFTAASLTGPIVFGLVGMCGSPNTSTAAASVVVGQTVADGSGMFTSGMFDQNECGAINSMIPLTGTYTADSTVIGRFTISLIVNPTQAKPLMLYLYDTNKGFLLEGTLATPGTEVAFGIITPQTLPIGGSSDASLAGTYGFGTVAPATTNVPNESGVATLTSNAPSTFAGTADVSEPATPFLSSGVPFSGNYVSTTPAVGRFTATATSAAPTTGSFVIYAVSAPGGFLMIEVTPNNFASPIFFFEQ